MRTPVLALGALLLPLWIPPAPGLAAQEPAGDDRPGWIGVGIQESLDCRARQGDGEAPEGVPLIRAADCRRVLVTEAVFGDGPAAEAGVRPGDTVVAVNGRAVSGRRGAEELGSLRPGRPVEVLLGREGGRASVRITPEPRPPEQGPAPVLAPGLPGLPARYAQPAGPRRAAPDRPGGVDAPALRLRLEDGELSAALKVDEEGHVYLERAPHELVRLKGVQLPPPKVRAMRDSALAEARERLREVRERIRAGAPPSGGAWSREEGGERIRMLGAEFLGLTSELAGNLASSDAGLLVLRVVPGTPAAQLGLRPGDVVVEAGGRAVAGAGDLRTPFAEAAPGDSVVVRWIRRSETMRGALQRR